jgi:hypothetical protein
MGWEERGGRRYLYRNRRVNGRPVKEYVAADDRFGFGEAMAADLARLLNREAKVRALKQEAAVAFRGRIDGLLAAAGAANASSCVVAEGLLVAVGFHNHNRGEWRMKRELRQLAEQIDRLKTASEKPVPMLNYTAPAGDAEAIDLFAKARAGDAAAVEQVRGLIATRGWAGWIGDIGRQATCKLIRKAAGTDPVWDAGITEKANAMRRDLLGPNPTALDDLLARRVVNGWVAVHALELELAVRTPSDRKDRDYLDRAITRAQKRMTDAAREFARLRRLELPAVLTRVAVTSPPALTAAPSAQLPGG